MTNSSHLDRQHPVRAILEQAALGGTVPSRKQLDELLVDDALPDGHSISRFRRQLSTAAEEVAGIARPGGSSHCYKEARDRADHHVVAFASAMTDPERSATGPVATTADLDAVASRMFGAR